MTTILLWSHKPRQHCINNTNVGNTVFDHELTTTTATKLAEEKAALEKRRKEREEAHLYMNVQVCTDENFKHWQGFDIVHWESTDDADPATPRTMRVLKALTIEDFVKMYAEQTNQDASILRPWVVVSRQNGTKRPDQPIRQLGMTLEEAAIKHGNRQAFFKMWMESKPPDAKVALPEDETQVNGAVADKPTDKVADKKQIILFLKYFDVEAQELKGAGHLYMSPSDRVQDLAGPFLKLMGWQAGSVDLKLFEEIKPNNGVESLKPKQTLQQSELQDGDIICFQKAYSQDEVAAMQQRSPSAYLEAPLFYDYLLNRIAVHFGPKPTLAQNITFATPEDAAFSLFLSRKDSYDNLAIKVAEYLSNVSKTTIDPTHLRFTTINSQTAKPRAIVKRSLNTNLWAILTGSSNTTYQGYGYTNQSPDSLYYEVLEMSLSDLEQRKMVKITWLAEGITKDVSIVIGVNMIADSADNE